MRLEAHLTTGDLQDALFQLTPLAVALDPDSPQRQLAIKPPSTVELLAGRGLRVVTELQLQWDLIGIRVPVTLRRVALLMTPRVQLLDGRPALLFTPTIEGADVSALPGFLEEAVVARLNEALLRPEARIVWRFTDTLDFSFPLPRQLQPQFMVRLYAFTGEVKVEDDSLRLTLEWRVSADADRTNDVDF